MRDGFIPGLRLNELFYAEVVAPLLARRFPDLRYSAALIGYGSDVLGFDTPRSTDHNWGPRLQLFLTPLDLADRRDALDQCLRNELPYSFRGYSVNFSEPDPTDNGTQVMAPIDQGPVRHLVEITSLAAYCERYLGLVPGADLQAIDWLTMAEQQLLELTAGRVYHDGLGQLEAMRDRLAYYPHDVWLYRLASQWQRIGQEEPFMARCGEEGDELGSRIVAARLVRDLMRLAFLLERRYAPYTKWLGTAFLRLRCGPSLAPVLSAVLDARPWTAREELLCEAYTSLGEMHNALGVIEPVAPTIVDFFGRPYRVLFAGRYADAAKAAIADSQIRSLPAAIGGIDQFADSVDLTDTPSLTRRSRVLFTDNPI